MILYFGKYIKYQCEAFYFYKSKSNLNKVITPDFYWYDIGHCMFVLFKKDPSIINDFRSILDISKTCNSVCVAGNNLSRYHIIKMWFLFVFVTENYSSCNYWHKIDEIDMLDEIDSRTSSFILKK